MPWNDLHPTVRSLALLGRIKPEIFDVFPPHGGPGLADRVESVALNPQPLPPHDPLVPGALAMARRLGQLAVEADLRGEESAGWVSEIIDDWCRTPWPRRFPWPGPGPRPEEGPFPEPWVLNQGRVAGATVFATLAASLGEGALRDALATGAERLVHAATQEG